jgi:hypothetical protein
VGIIGKVRKGRVGWFCFEPLMDGWWLPLSASSGIHCPLPRRNYSLSLVSHSPPPSHSTSHPTLIPFSPLLIPLLIPFSPLLIPLSSHSHPILLHLVLNPLSSHLPSGSHPIILHRVLIPSQMALGLCVWVISLSPCLVSCVSQSLSSVSVCVCSLSLSLELLGALSFSRQLAM